MGLYQFKLPDIGEGMHEGELIKWHIKPGDQVEEDQVIAEVQNDKAIVELPSPVQGKVKEIKASEGTVAVVGDILVTFEVTGEKNMQIQSSENGEKRVEHSLSKDNAATGGAASSVQAAQSPLPSDKETRSVRQEAMAPTASAADKVLATPSVRRLSREKGVDIAQIRGTGRHGQITKEDILEHASRDGQKEQMPIASVIISDQQQEERVALKGIRKIIASAMVKSVYTIPHVTIMDEANVSKLVEFRAQIKPLAEKKGVKLTYLPFIVKALVAAAREFPILNASMDDEKDEIVYHKFFHVGIATDTNSGLLVPVVKEADRHPIWSIAGQINDLANRGREGKLTADEMKGSTITITNIGSAGGMFFTPVIHYPEAAILGIGRITEKPVVVDGAIVIGQLMAISLSFDHRIIDGATAQQAVNYIKRLLEDPQLLMMEV